jgi:hypothetical protein
MVKFWERYIRLFGSVYFSFGYNFNIFKLGIEVSPNHIDINFGFVWVGISK